MCLLLLEVAAKRLQASATLFRWSPPFLTAPGNDTKAILRRLSRRLRHRRHLVDPVALSILPHPLLRALVAEFLSLPGRLFSFITSLLLLPLTILFGKIDTPWHVDVSVSLIPIISAVCISRAHVLYYVAIRKVGV